MTGFGRAEGTVGSTSYVIEVKSLNGKYVDVRFRSPSHLMYLELPLTEILKTHFERGSFEIQLRPKPPSQAATFKSGTRFAIDESAMTSLLEGVEWLHKDKKISLDISLEFLALTNRVFVAVDETPDPRSLEAGIKPIYEFALLEVKQMRESEGKRLETFFWKIHSELKKEIQGIRTLSSLQPNHIREKLNERIRQWKVPLDSTRLEWEVAVYADKADVTEELDRFESHLRELEKCFAVRAGIGRKLDFLAQELHREMNTVGAKAVTQEMTHRVISAKTFIEKLREQAQNVE